MFMIPTFFDSIADAAEASEALKGLAHASRGFDGTPSGMLLHGIEPSIAEFYSQNLATEVVKGQSHKVAQGGTVTKAPIGYRNMGVRDEFGREVRTVEIDRKRAPLVW